MLHHCLASLNFKYFILFVTSALVFAATDHKETITK